MGSSDEILTGGNRTLRHSDGLRLLDALEYIWKRDLVPAYRAIKDNPKLIGEDGGAAHFIDAFLWSNVLWDCSADTVLVTARPAFITAEPQHIWGGALFAYVVDNALVSRLKSKVGPTLFDVKFHPAHDTAQLSSAEIVQEGSAIVSDPCAPSLARPGNNNVRLPKCRLYDDLEDQRSESASRLIATYAPRLSGDVPQRGRQGVRACMDLAIKDGHTYLEKYLGHRRVLDKLRESLRRWHHRQM